MKTTNMKIKAKTIYELKKEAELQNETASTTLVSSFFAFAVEVVVTVETATISCRTFCSRTSYSYVDYFSIIFSLIQFVDSFLSLCIVSHFYETKAT